MKIIFVIQRYGSSVIGGAELHCRLIAEMCASHHDVEIVTTCAADYLTWKNVYKPGIETVDGLTVRRFPTSQTRPDNFDVMAHNALYGYPSMTEQHDYIKAHGPVCPELVTYLNSCEDVDCFVLFSYRYWTTWQAARTIGSRAILVPTAEHDKTLYLKAHAETFRNVAAIAYNSPEERLLIETVADNRNIPGVTVGVGLPDAIPCETHSLKTLDLPQRYFLYIGRIEDAKGCHRLMADYMTYYHNTRNPVSLVFIGKQEIPIPDHPGIFYLGVQPEDVKLGVLAAAEALVMPSRFESLSMVLLEAWKMHRPAICNSHCEVLRGQCLRANGGLLYRNSEEFIEVATLLTSQPEMAQKLGSQGNHYFQQNYTWPVIQKRYTELLSLFGDVS